MTRSTPYYASIIGQRVPCATRAEAYRLEEREKAAKQRRANAGDIFAAAMEELRCDPVLGDADHRKDPQRERFKAFLEMFRNCK